MKKILLRADKIKDLVVGDCLMEMNRFTKKYRIYRIIQKDSDGMGGRAEIVSSNYPTKGPHTVWMDFKAHSHHKNSAWITYYLPIGKLLYAKN